MLIDFGVSVFGKNHLMMWFEAQIMDLDEFMCTGDYGYLWCFADGCWISMN